MTVVFEGRSDRFKDGTLIFPLWMHAPTGEPIGLLFRVEAHPYDIRMGEKSLSPRCSFTGIVWQGCVRDTVFVQCDWRVAGGARCMSKGSTAWRGRFASQFLELRRQWSTQLALGRLEGIVIETEMAV